MSSRHVDIVAAAIVDGDSLDWASATDAIEPHENDVVRELRILATIDSATGERWRRSPRRPAVFLRLACAAAMTWAVVGGAASVAAAARLEVSWLRLVAIGAFGGAAAFLRMGGVDRRAFALSGAYWSVAAAFAPRAFEWLAAALHMPAVAIGLRAIRPEAFLPMFLWEFAREFPAVTRLTRFDRWCAAAARLSALMGFLLALNGLLALVIHRSAASADWLDRVGFWLLVFGASLPALGAIAIRARRAGAKDLARVRFFLGSLVIGIAPVVVELLLEIAIPPFGRTMQSPTGEFWGGFLIYPPLFLVPIATAYAIRVHRVLDVRTVLHSALRYLFTRWVITAAAAVPATALVALVYRHRDESLSAIVASPAGLALSWALAAVVGAILLRSRLVRLLDRAALPDARGSAAAIAELANALKHSRTASEAMAAAVDAVSQGLQAPAVGYVVREATALEPLAIGAPVHEGSLLPVALSDASGPCVVAAATPRSLYSVLSDADRRWIDLADAVLALPIRGSRTARVSAVIMVGRRRNALSFSADDHQFLAAVASTFGMAFESMTAPALNSGGGFQELAVECPSCSRVFEKDSCVCGSSAPPRRAALPLVVSGRFLLERRLGSGGMGVVYQATDTLLHRAVAVKTMPRLSGEAADNLIAEARTMASLAHPNVAVLYDASSWQGTPLLVMELLPGGTLAGIRRSGPMPLRDVLDVAVELAGALTYLHGRGLFHGDLKPSNLGLDVDRRPKLLDFGLTRIVAPPRDDGAVAGTLPYLDPLVISGHDQAGPRSDLWALAVVVCELAARHPFMDGASTARRIWDGFQADDWTSRLPASLVRWLADALSADPSRRPRDAAGFQESLERVRQSGDYN